MTLLHFDGFDAKASSMTGAYYTIAGPTMANYITGRFGSGFSLQGVQNTATGLELVYQSGVTRPGFVTGFAYQNGPTYNGYQGQFMGFYSGSSRVLTMRITETGAGATAGIISVYVGGTLLGTSTVQVPTGSWHHIEIKVIAGLGTSGTFQMKQNGVLTMNYPGVNTGAGTLTGVSLMCADYNQGWGWAPTFDDWWLCDAGPGTVGPNNDFMGDLRVLGISPMAPPQGNGTYSQLMGSDGNSVDNCALVNEIPPSTSQYVGAPTPGLKDTYVYADLPTQYTTIKGVRIVSQAAKTDAGPVSGRMIVRNAGTDYSGPDCVLAPTPALFTSLYENDPATSAPWTPSGLNSAEFGWEVRA